MKWACLATAVSLICLAYLPAADPSDRPNIVYILAEDMGVADVQILNPKDGRIATPNLDRLAKAGRVFTDAHSGSSVYTPTRYGILTGRYAWRTRLQRGVLDSYDKPLISAERLTVPRLLGQPGYHSACIGKWHLGYTVSGGTAETGKNKGNLLGAPRGAVTADGPVTRGFDLFAGFHHARMMKSFFDQDRVTAVVEPIDMLRLLVERSTAYICQRAATGKPFFLYLPLNSPHTPIVPSKHWQGKSGLGDYGDFVMQTDWAVGEVMSAIEQAKIAQNTLVIFTADNGFSPHANTEHLEKNGHFPSAGYHGYKSDIWEGGHRVPFIVRWPERVPAGTRSKQVICLTDLMATCAELVGVKLPDSAGEDNVSMLSALVSDPAQPIREATVHHSINGYFSIRQGRWKLCLCAGGGGQSVAPARRLHRQGPQHARSSTVKRRKDRREEMSNGPIRTVIVCLAERVIS
jgi:arylsulfatase A